MQELRILHLEDDPFFADMVERLLEAQGMRFRIRKSGDWDAFVAALREDAYDLILSDHGIPGGDGLKALSLCRRECPTVPFIFLSGMLGEELAIESLKNGASDYVLKSNMSRFIPTVVRTLAAFRETAALRAAEARIRRDQANLHSLIENTTGAIWSMDLDFNILVFNSAASLLSLKMTGQPMVEGSCLLERLAPEMQSLWREAARRIRKGDRFVQEHELEWSGRKGTMEISFHPISTGKAVTGMAVFGKDVTERKRVEAAGIAVEEQRRRLAGLYRKLRIPVHGLTRTAGLLGRTPLDEAQRGYLGMMFSSVQRISALHEKAEAFEAGLSAVPPQDPRLDPETPIGEPVPAAAPPARKPRPEKTRPEGVERRKRSPVPLRILVVEDNPINQLVAMRYLEILGCTADVSVNGQEAVEAYRRQGYDLVLMDCQMPVMDGFEATLAIRAIEAGTGGRAWITAITANVMPGIREKCLGAGMDSYLSKPLQMELMKQEIQRAEELREARSRESGGVR
ncbi:MAG TPA: response regulator [Fibrobacteria bacterium]|nr:response regulator [Fibrobacteria bacterium]